MKTTTTTTTTITIEQNSFDSVNQSVNRGDDNDNDDDSEDMDTSLSSVPLDSEAAAAAPVSPHRHRQHLSTSRRFFSLRRGGQPSNAPAPEAIATTAGEQPAKQVPRKQRLRKLATGAKTVVDKINIGKWIDNLEKDQELADHLEVVNHEYQQVSSQKILVGHVREECLDGIRQHLEQFWENHHHSEWTGATLPLPTYEDWIRQLHPDNVQPDGTIDARFYIPDCDHLVLWNQNYNKTQHLQQQDEFPSR
jgi:hypothetical protein